MSVTYQNTYWLLGDGADEEARRWIANDERKNIVASSPRAVEFQEIGNYLSPQLPIPPEGFLVVVISENDVQQHGLTLGVAHWGGEGGWIEPQVLPEDQAATPAESRQDDKPETTRTKPDYSPETNESILAEADFLEELKKMDEPGVQTQPPPVREKPHAV